jgi:uncharacterized membrane protein
MRAYLLAGILVTAPIGLTLYLTWLMVNFIDNQVMPLIPQRYNPETYLPISIPGLGLLLAVLVLIFIGWLAAGLMGRWFVRFSEKIMATMPIVRGLHSAIKQIMETVLAQKSNAFRQVVLVEYPRKNLWAIAFVTADTTGEVGNLYDDEMVNIFLPTTPNPTSGFLLFVPRSDVHMLNMSVEDGIKMVVSAGLVTPPDHRAPHEKLSPVIHVENNGSGIVAPANEVGANKTGANEAAPPPNERAASD